MSLKQLADILPGYVTLHIHTNSEAWPGISAAMVSAGDFPGDWQIINASPISPYTMEVSVKYGEVV